MQDMLVALYSLPDSRQLTADLAAAGIACRRAESFERSVVLDFVAAHFPNWCDEAEAAFARSPATLYVAIERGKVVGFAAYNVARPDFFGPTGVDPAYRGRWIGALLLLRSLEALREEGYGYAIIAGVGPAAFYERVVGATLIPGSDPGIYAGMLRRDENAGP
jgi:GNAT superfamily N-acetyltransferase